MKTRTQIERRRRRRFELPLTVHFRQTRKGAATRWGAGTIQDMSSGGVSFRCRGALPVGCHLELKIAWPATRGSDYMMYFRATGLVVRSSGSVTAMRITWHRLDLEPAVEMPLSAIA